MTTIPEWLIEGMGGLQRFKEFHEQLPFFEQSKFVEPIARLIADNDKTIKVQAFSELCAYFPSLRENAVVLANIGIEKSDIERTVGNEDASVIALYGRACDSSLPEESRHAALLSLAQIAEKEIAGQKADWHDGAREYLRRVNKWVYILLYRQKDAALASYTVLADNKRHMGLAGLVELRKAVSDYVPFPYWLCLYIPRGALTTFMKQHQANDINFDDHEEGGPEKIGTVFEDSRTIHQHTFGLSG